MATRVLGDPRRADADLPELSGRDCDGADEIEPGFGALPVTDERLPGPVQDATRVGQQRSQIRPKAGSEDDAVEPLFPSVRESDAVCSKGLDGWADLDLALADFCDRTNVEHGNAPFLLDHPDWPLLRLLHPEAFH